MKLLLLSISAGLLAMTPLAAQDPETIEGLTKIEGARADVLYLLPDVDFRAYTKVMLDPTEVAFRRNFVRNYNRTVGTGRRIGDEAVQRAADQFRTGFGQIFADAYRNAGYEVVTQPGPDVLRLRTGVLNLYVAAPDQMSAGRTRSYSVEAGEATLVIEARDSLSGALLGRAFDQRLAGDNMAALRTSVSNRADFEQLFRHWARASVRGLEELKASSPVNVAAPRR
ncbi:MAG: DUF3313 domain-containing protein [Alphaproteobacteria bacterium]|nr:MAG: DUF3313 domain-containing protein [Alphaproteobacteria bacterium]